jgi:lysophospholipase L1-like esterase
MFQCAIAGSGFLADAGAGLAYGATARIDALVAAAPDLIVLEASGNDSEGYTFAQMRDAKIAWSNQVAAALPSTRIVVTDVPPRGASVAVADYTARNLASTRAAINAVPNVNIIGYHDYIGVLNGTPAYTTGATYSVGNRVVYNGSVWECLAAVSSAPSVMLTRDWKMFGSYTGTGNSGSRTVANGVLNSTTTITSSTAAFTAADVGVFVTGTGIPAGAKIASVTNGTTAVLSVAATATATGVSITITGQKGDGTRDSLLGPDNLHPADAGALALAYQYWPDVQVDIARDTRVGILPNAEAF